MYILICAFIKMHRVHSLLWTFAGSNQKCFLPCLLTLPARTSQVMCMAVDMQGTTYKAALHMDLVIAEEGAAPVRLQQRMGQLPIMVKSRACYLRNLSQCALHAAVLGNDIASCSSCFKSRACHTCS